MIARLLRWLGLRRRKPAANPLRVHLAQVNGLPLDRKWRWR